MHSIMPSFAKNCPPSCTKVVVVTFLLVVIPACCVLSPTLRCMPSIVYAYTKWGFILYGRQSTDGKDQLNMVVKLPTSARPAPSEIPRIVHQMWATDIIPDRWADVVKSCRDMYHDWQYILWTDSSMRDFVQVHYPHFLAQYDAYPYNIQRADVFRYLVLLKYGGIYIDLDVGCVKRLDDLLNNTVVLPLTHPLGFSNEFMMAAPGAPFMARLVERLPSWATSFGTKYPTVMFSTGPMFVTVQHAVYSDPDGEVSVMPDTMYGKFAFNASTAYLRHVQGSSWHGTDSLVVFWLYSHLAWLVRVGLVLVLTVLVIAALWAQRAQSVRYRPMSPKGGRSKDKCCIV